MISLRLTRKWWLGMVAGVFGVLGIGTALVAMPALADVGGAPNAAPEGVNLRVECKQGTWRGQFRWTLAGNLVGDPVALPDCPDGRRRSVTLPTITMPGTGAATTAGTGAAAAADGFQIRVAGRSGPDGASAECTFPSPNLNSKELRRRNVTFTCTADGGTRNSEANLKIKLRWVGSDDGNNNNSNNSNNNNNGNNGNNNGNNNNSNNGNQGKNGDNDQKLGWLSVLSRGRKP